MLAGPLPLPDDIRNELLQQRTNKTRTFVVAVLASLLIASIAAALTGAAWAYAWMLAELVLGSTRIYLMMKALAQAKADRRIAPNITPIWAGLTSVILTRFLPQISLHSLRKFDCYASRYPLRSKMH